MSSRHVGAFTSIFLAVLLGTAACGGTAAPSSSLPATASASPAASAAASASASASAASKPSVAASGASASAAAKPAASGGLSSGPNFGGPLQVKTDLVLVTPRNIARLSEPANAQDQLPVGIIMIHPRSSYLDNPACTGLAARGIHTLCMNGRYFRFAGKADDIIWDDLALDIKAGVEFMHKQPGVQKIVLVAYSGGGPLMSYYQAVAENGVKFCQDPRRIFPCSNDLANMPAADGMVMLESHIGYSSNALFQHNPMVVKDDQFGQLPPGALDSSLDAFSPANGYDPKAPTYTDDFLKRFFAGQAAREDRLVKIAQDRWAAIQAGKSTYKDDEPFIIPRHSAQIFSLDPRLLSETKAQYDVIRPGGMSREQVHTVRVPGNLDGDPTQADSRYEGSGTFSIDVRSFLSTYAIRTNGQLLMTKDDIQGVDWASSNSATLANLPGIHVPQLFIAGTGWYWMVPSEMEYDATASTDKQQVYVDGMLHSFAPCTDCAKTPGQFGDTRKELLDAIAQWLKGHFA
ncbi:MAG TPA: hypothetical protein VK009_20660 [Chloroflexota bacterium]|nr:hypothetical protein [Chloroflexota bacterium]